MIYTVTLNPAIDKTIVLEKLKIGSVNRTIFSRTDVGGKGINVSKVLKILGCKSTATGILGNKNADMFIEYLHNLDIETKFHIIEGESRTNIKIVEKNNNMCTDINDKGLKVQQDEINKFITSLLASVTDGDIVVLCGSLPVGVNPDIYKEIILQLNERKVKTILDADDKPLVEGIEGAPHIVKPNISELKKIANVSEENTHSIIESGRKLIEKGIEKVLISLGSKGSYYITSEVCLYAFPIEVDIKSTVGAGDSLVAGLAYSLENNLNEYETLKLATASATAKIMTEGTKEPNYNLIQELLDKVKIIEC
ncbi:hypothetical protein TR13x_09555 [Caloranaerobacter sp. TR13]|uniref:1-phosphofructokinase n=1 Tax=Caloranaerobacter sp. TR13 TaxID=1302151 RepID=UPI0006D41496|nr:1-phosphofructokinase [Caloranaerobacter sp. TR13]KPU26580.1 hypothetical protein TR13x_09555 [Caloranaerobacter sp. TR13]